MVSKLHASEIAAERIGKSFGDFVALAEVSLTVKRGEFLTLLGPSGSGKTTFLMVVAGFEVPTTGRMLLDGADLTSMPAERRGFGMMFQGYALFPHMSVQENIAFPLRVQRRPPTEIRRRVGEMIEKVGLTGHQNKRPSALSGGQQQRVALARALVYEPTVMLLDEPFSALDKSLRGQMQDEVRRLHRETGTTFIFVTHDQSEALALSSRIAIFDKGRLQQIGEPRAVYERPTNRFVAEFLGDVNILPLTLDNKGKALCEGRSLTLGAPIGPQAMLAVRPEYMDLMVNEPPKGNALSALVTDLTYLGADTRVAMITPAKLALTLTVPTARLPSQVSTGSPVWVTWRPEDGQLL